MEEGRMEVLAFALQTIRRVDSGRSVSDDVSHPRRMHWIGWERHVDQAHGELACGIGPGAEGLTDSEGSLVESAGQTWQ